MEREEVKKSMPAIIVEGPIAAGKSTLVKQLAFDLGAVPVLEGVLEDGDAVGNPWLNEYYRDAKNIAFATQMWFLSNRFTSYMPMMNRSKLYIGDRSLWGDACFAKVQKNTGKMDSLEYETYTNLLKVMLDLLNPPLLTVFLEADVDYLMKRIEGRGRDMEKAISREYMTELDNAYMEFMEDYPHLNVKINCSDIEGRNSCTDRDNIIYKRLLTFIKSVMTINGIKLGSNKSPTINFLEEAEYVGATVKC
jgi:deoxyadenosine/deoxycytidine kinase